MKTIFKALEIEIALIHSVSLSNANSPCGNSENTWKMIQGFVCILDNMLGILHESRRKSLLSGLGQVQKIFTRVRIWAEFQRKGVRRTGRVGQSTSWEMLGWMKHKLESRLPGEISITSDMQMIPPYSRKWRRTKEPLDESERGERVKKLA